MIMRQSYLDDLKDFIHSTPDEFFENYGFDKNDLLHDKETLERLWVCFQKSVEEYDVDADYAYKDALQDVLGIPMET